MSAKVRSIFKLLRYIQEIEKLLLISGIFASIANAIRPFTILIISKVLIEGVLFNADFKLLLRKILILLFVYVALSIIHGYCEKRHQLYGITFKRKNSERKAEHLLSVEYQWTESEEMQDLIATIINLENKNVFGPLAFVEYIKELIGSFVGMLLSIYLVHDIFFTGKTMTGISENLLDIGFIILFIVVFLLTLKTVTYINSGFSKAIGGETTSRMRYIKAYNQIVYQYKVAKDIRLYNESLVEEYTKTHIKYYRKIYDLLAKVLTKNIGIETALSGLTIGLVYVFVGYKALNGSISISSVLLYIGVFSQIVANAMSFVDVVSMLFASELYREKLMEYYEKGSIESKINQEQNHKNIPHSYSFENLSFKYPGSDVEVLKNISFTIKPLEKIAILGVNGSGKTTLIKVLLGLYNNYTGKIYIDDSEKNRSYDYRHLFSPVFQDFKLLAISLRDNITAFNAVHDLDIKSALDEVGMKEFYTKHGLDVILGKDFEASGIEISGGESQKIAMARALVRDGDMFILDEPTAALDPISEYEVYKNFNKITKSRTTIFISHRLSSCKFCDRIFVMDGGRIVQSGSHEELVVQKGSKYQELWEAQAKHYRINAKNPTSAVQ